MAKVLIACVGGFLGAGKTTTLQRAAAEFANRGLKVGVITNDQGAGLVDTEALRSKGFLTEEITGGCFCCRFDELVETAGALIAQERPDVILAEAVGSCTDLSATVYQPLRQYYPETFSLAPLTIVVEPERIRSLRDGGDSAFPDSVRYLFRKQLAEADLILLNKLDTLGAGEERALTRWLAEEVSDAPVLPVSALTGAGVPEWIDRLLGGGPAGMRLLEIDYQTYADAEAALGWLNATVAISSDQPFKPKDLAETFMRHAHSHANAVGMGVAHLKAMVAAGKASDRIALTDGGGAPQWTGAAVFPDAQAASLVINARMGAQPQSLTDLVETALAQSAADMGVTASVSHLECFTPSPPTPVHRFSALAEAMA
jgi:G3E family GTPase